MQLKTFDVSGPILFIPRIHTDERGSFAETFRADVFTRALKANGQNAPRFVQQNQSVSHKTGTLRGLHYQKPPHAQGKLIACTQGKIQDVVVDIRRGSATYGQSLSIILRSEDCAQLWVPPGFLHGFVCLSDNTVIAYQCTDYYAPNCEGTIVWDDPDLAIDWQVEPANVILSGKDKCGGAFANFDSSFTLD